MLEFLKDMLLIFGRIVTIIPLLLFVTLFMGKRAIGELPVFDFLIVIILGALVGADIADPEIEHLPTAIAIIAIGIFQRIVSGWKLSNRKVGRILTFEPTVVIQDGKFVYDHMKKIRYSIDNVLQMLREKDVFDINDVETAIVEANGALSVLKKPNQPTEENMQNMDAMSSISFPVIVEGTVYRSVLEDMNVTQVWLEEELRKQGIHDTEEVFFASLNRKLVLHVSLKQEEDLLIPPIKH